MPGRHPHFSGKKTNSERLLDLPEGPKKWQTHIPNPAPLSLRPPTLSGCFCFDILNILTYLQFFFLAFPTFRKILLERKDSLIILFFSSYINNLSSLKQYLSLLLLMNVMKRLSQWCFLHFCRLLSRVGL